jgi:hypothetical protein
MTAIDADGYIWSIDINGDFRRAQGSQTPNITNPDLFAFSENIHYKVNNQRPIEEVNYDLPPSNYSYRNNAIDYPAPQEDNTVKNFTPNKSKKLTRLPNLDFLSKIKLGKLRTPLIIIACLLVAIIAIGGNSNEDKVIELTSTEKTNVSDLPVEDELSPTKEVKKSLVKEFNSEKTGIKASIISGKMERAETLDTRLYFSLLYLSGKGYIASFSEPECLKESCSFVVKLSLKSKIYSYPMTISKKNEIWSIKEIE